MAATEYGGWKRTPWYHDGSPVFRNEATGELAAEMLQEARLVALSADVAAAFRFLADFDRAVELLGATSAACPR